jgi:rhamnosyltransferase
MEMLGNMPNIINQVQGMVVVDNGSPADELDGLREASRSLGFHLIENDENLGIAEAMNQGVRWAKSRDYPWVILFDQDSKITDGFISQMFAAWHCHPERERVCSIHPRYVHPETHLEGNVRRAKDGGPIKSMTSGSLMTTWIFDRIGWFATEYFIDEVDTEYCFRIRAAGYLLADSRKAILLHSVGQPEVQSLFGFSFRPTNHSALRRYYMSRNQLAVYRKYFRKFPLWVLHSAYESFRETVKCFLGEHGRARKLRNTLRGVWDGLTGKMGKREGL